MILHILANVKQDKFVAINLKKPSQPQSLFNECEYTNDELLAAYTQSKPSSSDIIFVTSSSDSENKRLKRSLSFSFSQLFFVTVTTYFPLSRQKTHKSAIDLQVESKRSITESPCTQWSPFFLFLSRQKTHKSAIDLQFESKRSILESPWTQCSPTWSLYWVEVWKESWIQTRLISHLAPQKDLSKYDNSNYYQKDTNRQTNENGHILDGFVSTWIKIK